MFLKVFLIIGFRFNYLLNYLFVKEFLEKLEYGYFLILSNF